MVAKIINIELDQNANTNIEYDWTDPSTNLPIDLTGYTARLQIRLRPGDDFLIQELNTSNGRIVLGGAAGTIVVSFLPADTSGGTWFNAFYDLYIIKTADGTETRVAKGFVTVSHGITQ